MVRAAEARRPANLSGQLEFSVGDVRSVRVGRLFDAVVSLFHVASYQTTNADLMAMFTTAAAHLRAGGVFVFDCWYGPGVLTDRPSVRVRRIQSEAIEVLRLAEPIMHPNDNVVDVNYTVQVRRRSDQKVSEFQETHRMRYLFAPEVRLMLEQAGFLPPVALAWLSDSPTDFSTWVATFVATRSP
jgi:hypothetical protein